MDKLFRVALVRTDDGSVMSENFSIMQDAEDWLLGIAEKHGVKLGWIRDRGTLTTTVYENL